MNTALARRLLPLAPLALLVACGTESPELPSAPGPSISAHHASGVGAESQDSTLSFAPAASTILYSLSVNPAALKIKQGAKHQTTVTITRAGFPKAVTLSLGNAPAGVTGVFNPAANITGTSSTLTVRVGSGVTPGVYNLTVRGTAWLLVFPVNRSTQLTLTVVRGVE